MNLQEIGHLGGWLRPCAVHKPSGTSPRAPSDPVFGFQGRPGLCPPVPPSPADPQRAEEHPSGEGHAHHHQVKPPPGVGRGSDGVGLAHFGLPNPPELNLCPAPGLGDVGQGSREGVLGVGALLGCSQKLENAPSSC